MLFPGLSLLKDLPIKPLLSSPSSLPMKSFLDVKLIKILAMAKQVIAVTPNDHVDKYSLFIFLVFLDLSVCALFSKTRYSLGKHNLPDSLHVV